MDRRLIPAHELRIGARVFVEPQKEQIPRGHKLDAVRPEGQWLTVTDYIHGCVSRGALLAWTGERPPEVRAPAVEPPVVAGSSEFEESSDAT